MVLLLAILGALTIAGAAAALILRNLVHCVLALTLAFVGLAGLYLLLGAQFIGFAQILVYVGAVAILIVFAVLLTRSVDTDSQASISPGWIASIGIATAAFVMLAWAICSSEIFRHAWPLQPNVSVKHIGDVLMLRFALHLEVIGVLLTAALIGAITIAMQERRKIN
jgi:NADH-quinone oxidoreductase subunit J